MLASFRVEPLRVSSLHEAGAFVGFLSFSCGPFFVGFGFRSLKRRLSLCRDSRRQRTLSPSRVSVLLSGALCPRRSTRPNVRPLRGQSSAEPLFLSRAALARLDRGLPRGALGCIGSPHPPVQDPRDGRTGAGRYVPAKNQMRGPSATRPPHYIGGRSVSSRRYTVFRRGRSTAFCATDYTTKYVPCEPARFCGSPFQDTLYLVSLGHAYRPPPFHALRAARAGAHDPSPATAGVLRYNAYASPR